MWPWRPYGERGPTLLELAQQAWSSTDHGYDLLAARFDHTPFRTPDEVVERALGVLKPARFKRGIDICCGTGAGLLRLRDHCEHVVGLDRSVGMLEQARSRVPEAELVQGDALDPPLGPGMFDVACSFGAFGHILVADEARFVRSVHALLAPRGKFVFVTGEPPPLLSRASVVSHAFNAAMRVRNAVKSPPFIMYYLTFLLPRARRLLEENGFDVAEHRGALGRDEWSQYVVVVATKR